VVFDELLLGRLTETCPLPLVQGMVAGNPGRAVVDENVQLVAAATCAKRVTWPPVPPSEFGDAAKDEIVGAGFAPTVILALAVTVFEPETESSNVYLAFFDDPSAGAVTLVVTSPVEHGTVNGRPLIVGDAVNVQAEPFATWAERFTEPPTYVNDDGDAAKLLMDGDATVPEAPCAGMAPSCTMLTAPASTPTTNATAFRQLPLMTALPPLVDNHSSVDDPRGVGFTLARPRARDQQAARSQCPPCH
jgi:hypothetical protein